MPAVVDLAAMRDAMKAMGGDPEKINPLAPVDLVIDHSVMVDFFGRQGRVQEERRDGIRAQRRALLVPALGPAGLRQFPRRAARHRHLPSGQSRISRPDRVDATSVKEGKKTVEYAYPDTLVGTDSHTTMINGLSVLGWGVGGIEAEAAMLGQPISMLIPEVIGFRFTGKLRAGVDRDRPRAHRDADAAQEGRGRQVRRVLRRRASPTAARGPRDDRQHGAGIRRDLRLLPDRCRDAALSERDGPRPRARRAGRKLRQGAGHVPRREERRDPVFTDTLDARSRRRSSRRSPARSGRRIAWRSPMSARNSPRRSIEEFKKARRSRRSACRSKARTIRIGHGDVVIAAITSCTNTSNPYVHAGRRPARAATRIKRGLKVKPWVKTSLAPGSQVVDRLSRKRPASTSRSTQLGFNLVGYGCTTCIGNSGPLPERCRQGGQRRRPRRRGRAFRQPQFRRPRQSAGARELSRLADARGRLRARRHDERRSHQGAARLRQEEQAGLSERHLAQPEGDRGHCAQVGVARHVPLALWRCVHGRRSWKKIKVDAGKTYRWDDARPT